MRITVLGATGGAGHAIVRELAGRGHAVTAASRTAASRRWPEQVVPVATDLADTRATARACVGADVVVMAAQVPYSRWTRELPGLVTGAADAAAAAGARFVMVDNLYAYGSPGVPITEGTPETAATRKGRLRAAIGRELLARHARGELRVTLGRFADHYGPHGGNSLLNQLVLEPGCAGRTVRTFIAEDQPHTFCYLPDVARGFATLIERPEADGRTWILPAAEPTTQAAIVAHLQRELSRTIRSRRVSPRLLWMLGLVDADLREAREVVAQFDRPYTSDASAFEAAFGPIAVTPHTDAVAATLDWIQGCAFAVDPQSAGR